MSDALIPLILIGINLYMLSIFAWDKRAAKRGDRRVPEARLLWLAALGGSVGAVLAQQVFHHKTRKEPFRSILLAIAVGHIALAVLWLAVPAPFWKPAFKTLYWSVASAL